MNDYKERIDKVSGAYDHIVWYGMCRRCGASRYIFIEENRKIGKADLTDVEVECKGMRCKGRCRIKGRVNNKRATHLNDIRKRGSKIKAFNRV